MTAKKRAHVDRAA